MRDKVGVGEGVLEGEGTTTPPKLNPSDAEFTLQAEPVYLNLQGSLQGATWRSTGHVQTDAVCTDAHLTVTEPVCCTTMA